MLISSNANYPLGLDISDLALKLVQLKKSGDKVRVQALSRVELPTGVLSKGEIRNEEAFLKHLSTLLNKPRFGTFTTNEVVACLPDTKSFIKLIAVDKSPNSLADIIEAEMEKHVPLTIKDIYFDWQIIDENDERYLVQVGACPKNTVDQLISVLAKARLSISALEIETIAICRSLLKEESPKNKVAVPSNYAIIDIGAMRSSITVYARGAVAMSISLPIAGEDITKCISGKLELNWDQAEKAKIICGLDKSVANGIVSDILSDTTDDLIERISESLAFYAAHFPDLGPVNQIFLCGGGANIKSLDKLISERLSLPAAAGNVFTHLTADSSLSESLNENHSLDLNGKTGSKLSVNQNISLSFATAIGLGLRHVFLTK